MGSFLSFVQLKKGGGHTGFIQPLIHRKFWVTEEDNQFNGKTLIFGVIE